MLVRDVCGGIASTCSGWIASLRTGIADTLTTLEQLRASGVEVVSVADGFDLAGPAAEIIISVMAWAAKMERLALGERISAARDWIESEGGSWGRPPRMPPEMVLKAQAMRSEGRSLRAISVALKIPEVHDCEHLGAVPKTSLEGEPERPHFYGTSWGHVAGSPPRTGSLLPGRALRVGAPRSGHGGLYLSSSPIAR